MYWLIETKYSESSTFKMLEKLVAATNFILNSSEAGYEVIWLGN